jgi:DNA-binding transcriptional ArsR family regulator
MNQMDIARLQDKAEEATKLLEAMANTKRLLILCSLLEREMNVSELEERVVLAQSALSQHLAKLRAWGLVKARRDGQQVHYSLASNAVRDVLSTLYQIYCVRGATDP